MNIYVLWLRNGKTVYAKASFSHNAIALAELYYKSRVSEWDIQIDAVPENALILS